MIDFSKKTIEIHQIHSEIYQNASKSMQIEHLGVKIDSGSARSRVIGFYIYSVCFFHMFEPAIFILDNWQEQMPDYK